MRTYRHHVRIYRRHRFGDWLRDTNHPDCSLENEGALLRAQDAYWEDECVGLPADVKQLARRLKIKDAQAKSMLTHAGGMHLEDGKIHFESVRADYEKALKQSKAQSDRRANGKPSGGDHGNPEDENRGDHGNPNPCEDGATPDASGGDQPVTSNQQPESSYGIGGGTRGQRPAPFGGRVA